MPDVPDPCEERWQQRSSFGTGTASLSFFPRHTTEADRKRWAKEDQARDLRRIPIGFKSKESA